MLGICFEVASRNLFYRHIQLLIMKNILIVFFLFMITTLSSCSVIADIFKAGVWVGVLAVVAVIVLIIYIISRVSAEK